MSIYTPAALGTEAVKTAAVVLSPSSAWFETALTVLFAAATVLFVSFLAVVTGLV